MKKRRHPAGDQGEVLTNKAAEAFERTWKFGQLMVELQKL